MSKIANVTHYLYMDNHICIETVSIVSHYLKVFSQRSGRETAQRQQHRQKQPPWDRNRIKACVWDEPSLKRRAHPSVAFYSLWRRRRKKLALSTWTRTPCKLLLSESCHCLRRRRSTVSLTSYIVLIIVYLNTACSFKTQFTAISQNSL